MSNTLYIHIGYWIVILLILFVGYLIYPKKQKKSSKRAGKNFCIEQSCPQKVNTISTSLEKKQVLLNMPSDDKDWHILIIHTMALFRSYVIIIRCLMKIFI